MLFWGLELLILFHGSVFAEVPDPEKDLVQIANSQSVVVGNYFYTVGGYETFSVPDGFPLGTKSRTWEGTRVIASNSHLRRIDLTRTFTVNKLDTIQEQSIRLSDEVPRMRFGTVWAHNTTIYLGPSDLEIYALLQNGVWGNETRKVPTTGIWTYDTTNPDAGWAMLSDPRYNGTFSLVTVGSVAYLDGIAYIMGGSYRLTTDLKNPDGTPATPNLAGVREVKLSSLFKIDMKGKVVTNETSSIGNVSSGGMVSVKSAGQNGILVYMGGSSSSGYNAKKYHFTYKISIATGMIHFEA
ncbi:hypothetical protein B9Z19DRAFT_1127561 [Tuber borchii]|uniref:Uncharacterized protein n=1 Tax=Tuber borchii TaxID=42251 RepID=A0A2T6ZR40_TUBBO|nr:hypothetical protein B9Z19DRAFT_1127561 [Tuber borchii]